MKDANPTSVLSERRKALFEPLEPRTNINGGRPSNESLLPPPDFDTATYPRGWLIGKKRKLVNVDVVESMRRIAVQEMNRKDREIDELNEVVEEDGRVLEHLQMQLLEERAKKADVERENAMLRDQINMLMDMLQADEGDEAPSEPLLGCPSMGWCTVYTEQKPSFDSKCLSSMGCESNNYRIQRLQQDHGDTLQLLI